MTQFDVDYSRAAVEALMSREPELFIKDVTVLLRGQKDDVEYVLSSLCQDLLATHDVVNFPDDFSALLFKLYCNQVLENKEPELDSSCMKVNS